MEAKEAAEAEHHERIENSMQSREKAIVAAEKQRLLEEHQLAMDVEDRKQRRLEWRLARKELHEERKRFVQETSSREKELLQASRDHAATVSDVPTGALASYGAGNLFTEPTSSTQTVGDADSTPPRASRSPTPNMFSRNVGAAPEMAPPDISDDDDSESGAGSGIIDQAEVDPIVSSDDVHISLIPTAGADPDMFGPVMDDDEMPTDAPTRSNAVDQGEEMKEPGVSPLDIAVTVCEREEEEEMVTSNTITEEQRLAVLSALQRPTSSRHRHTRSVNLGLSTDQVVVAMSVPNSPRTIPELEKATTAGTLQPSGFLSTATICIDKVQDGEGVENTQDYNVDTERIVTGPIDARHQSSGRVSRGKRSRSLSDIFGGLNVGTKGSPLRPLSPLLLGVHRRGADSPQSPRTPRSPLEKAEAVGEEIPLLLELSMKQSMIDSILSQYQMVNRASLHLYFRKLNLKGHLEALRRYLLMQAGDVMEAFSTNLFEGMRRNPPTNWHIAANVQGAFDTAIRQCGKGHDELHRNFVFSVKDGSPGHEVSVLRSDKLHVLDHITLEYDVPWPVNVVITSKSLQAYNRIFSFFLRLRRITYEMRQLWKMFKAKRQRSFKAVGIKYSLLSPSTKGSRRLRSRSSLHSSVSSLGAADDDEQSDYGSSHPPQMHGRRQSIAEISHEDMITHEKRLRELELFRLEMQHLTNTLQGYLITEVLDTCWIEFCSKLEAAKTVYELRTAHEEYILRALHRCFLGDKTKTVMSVIDPLLQLMLLFKSKVAQLDFENRIPTRSWNEVTKVVEDVRRHSDFLYTVLRKLAQRGFQHMHDLVVRLDYNDFFIERSEERKRDS